MTSNKNEFFIILTCLIIIVKSDDVFNFDSNGGCSTNKNDWMSNIKDDQLLTKLFIPGTHDSAAYKVLDIAWTTNKNNFYVCQSMTIEKQLEKGIRYFDLRIKKNGVLYHGSGRTTYDTTKLLNIFKDFLNNHKKEFILLRLKSEDGKSGSSTGARDKFNAIGFQLDSLKGIKVGDVRKRVVMLSFESTPNMNLMDYSVSDDFKPGSENKKIALITEFYKNNRVNDEKMFFVHFSATKIPGTYPSGFSRVLNKAYIKGNFAYRPSVLIFDFPSCDLINKIINFNIVGISYK